MYFVNTTRNVKGGASVTEVWEGEYDIGSQNQCQEGSQPDRFTWKKALEADEPCLKPDLHDDTYDKGRKKNTYSQTANYKLN